MRRLLLGISLAGLSMGVAAAQSGSLTSSVVKTKQYIVFASDEQVVTAGKKSTVELHFKVNDGFHVNSHTPKSELLIPTNLTLQPAAGVTASAVEYPAGTAFSFSFEPGEKLDVYTGTFTVKIPVVAAAGSHTVQGVLHYQACDNAACYPPKSLPVEFVLTAKAAGALAR
ncbi:protein-disulfide reductase DsbD N-terminal domain-containing protein [Edaphobacter flagellatus]|uniref:protein-disulfide reductase DsbD N-terminal domain-containing protein n=1 Tax=Edaphobacter flagellatus TaxID=1933044 RepID=UPI0021B352D9|nr:protein-disulfide reductase DsbD N-terminal domain-containing protein [Edaphobacter flagellatus]